MSSISLDGAYGFTNPQLTNATINQPLLGTSVNSLAEAENGGSQLTNPLLDGQDATDPLSSLFQTTQTAVGNALQSAQTDQSSGANQIIEQAIVKALQQAGSADSTNTNTSGSSGGSSSNSGSSQVQSFFQLLSDFGVNVQQFQTDFAAAVQQIQNGGTSDGANVFSSFPSGTAIDALG